MQLTDQMKAEFDGISKYVNGMDSFRTLIRKEIVGGRVTLNSQKYIAENAKQLSSHKVRLQNFLCETDLKEAIIKNLNVRSVVIISVCVRYDS